jgi:type VI secretion system protein
LERIRDARAGSPLTIGEDTELLARSILNHMQRLLNSRQGESLCVPDYGIPDVAEVVHAFPDSIGDMQKAIQTSIEKYEPRLGKVRVKRMESEGEVLELRFEILAQLVTAKKKAFLKFETIVDPDGKIRIRD